jgi:hypothetical protein
MHKKSPKKLFYCAALTIDVMCAKKYRREALAHCISCRRDRPKNDCVDDMLESERKRLRPIFIDSVS